MTELHFYCPDYLNQPEPVLPPALALLLARGDSQSWPYLSHSGLLQLFGATEAVPGIAALSYWGDSGEPPAQPRQWLRADPVYLRPDRQFLRLFDARVLNLEWEEAQALSEEIRAFYAEDEWQFRLGSASRWYLRLPQAIAIQTHTLSEVAGCDIGEFLPQGENARAWHTRLNEVQMLLHQSPLNQARQARGELPVNSLWFWGEGDIPPPPASAWTQVYADDALARGFSHWQSTPCAPLPETLPTDAGKTLLLLDAQAPLETVESAYFAPALQRLRAGDLKRLVIYLRNNRRVALSRRSLWRFWRR